MGLAIVRLDTRVHDRPGFCCGVAQLDTYLRLQAGQHQRDGIATTHVLVATAVPEQVLGYVTLAAAQLELDSLEPADRKRMPRYPVPAVRVSRLAVAQSEQGKGYGQLLVGHAVTTSLRLRAELGVRVLIVDALNERVVNFYRAYGFRPTTARALTLYLPLGKNSGQ